MTRLQRDVVETVLLIATAAAIFAGCRLLEKYEAWRGDLPSRAARGARRSPSRAGRAPHSRTDPVWDAYCDLRGIRQTSVRSTARSATPRGAHRPEPLARSWDRGRATRTQGRPHRSSH